ncbi:MAG: endonuclease/exonuclease/phosphatase family protein [Treponema sp.]|nr:endonuclease/exonuclease/phosphatase family protein [Treponema sp.]
MKKIIKRAAAGAAILIGLVIVFAAVFIGVLTITEFRPAQIENLDLQYHAGFTPAAGPENQAALPAPAVNVPFSILTWNIGYASLDQSQDFFMDGGKGIRPASDQNVRRNLAGIRDFIDTENCHAVFIQEADVASKRSYYVDQAAYLTDGFYGFTAFAPNFRCLYVPIPFPQAIGRVYSGLLTLNRFNTAAASRISLPNPFSWPTRAANLKRCLLVSRIPLAASPAFAAAPVGASASAPAKQETPELVLVNLHLEAYDSSGGREAQTKALLDFLYAEYANGNYCIAGGDFNQNFPGIDPVRFAVKNSDNFMPGTLDGSLLKEGWQFAADLETPSCRLLNEPYSGNPEETQFYVIDGFILSPNVELLNVQTAALDFRYSDHNPVRLDVFLKRYP